MSKSLKPRIRLHYELYIPVCLKQNIFCCYHVLKTYFRMFGFKNLCIYVKSVFLAAWKKPRRAFAQPPASALASTLTLKFFKSLYFLNHLMDLVHIWYNDRYRSKVSISNTLPWPTCHKGKKLGHKFKS